MTLPTVGSDRTTLLNFRPVDWAKYLLLPGICLLPLLLGAPFFLEPFERDEGVYATVAQGLLHGDLPYRDYLDHKPPLIYVWYAVSFLIFGEGILAPRLMASCVWALTTLIVYKQAGLLFTRSVALLASLIFALSSSLVLLQANANTEAFMLLPLTFSLFALTKGLRTHDHGWLLVAGVAGALATLTKQVAALSLLFGMVLVLTYATRERGLASALKDLGLFAAGFISVTGLALVPFILTNSLDDFYYANWTYNRLYAAEVSLSARFDAEAGGLRFLWIVAGPLLLLAILGLLKALEQRTPGRILLGLWLVAGYGGILASGRAFPHYYVSLLPVLALLAGIGVSALSPALTRPRLSTKVFVSLLAFSLALSVGVNGHVYVQPSPEAKHSLRFSAVNPEPQNKSRELASYIAATTSPHDQIYNYGRETQLYFYADRRPASRFIYDRPFWLDPPTFQQAIRDLRSTRPLLIIDTVAARSAPDWDATHPPALQALLASDYRFVGRFEFADIYRLKGK